MRVDCRVDGRSAGTSEVEVRGITKEQVRDGVRKRFEGQGSFLARHGSSCRLLRRWVAKEVGCRGQGGEVVVVVEGSVIKVRSGSGSGSW